MTVGQVIAKLGIDPKEYERGLRNAEAQANQVGSKIGSIFKNAFSVSFGIGMFEALKKGFKATVGTAIDFNAMLQTARIGFTTMLGSAEKAQAFLDDMADFATKTPFEYPELLEASKRMLAYGFAAKEVLPILRAVGDTAAAVNSGADGIDRITLALGQIRAKGKLAAEEMRQLTEAGVPAWEMLAEAMGFSADEVGKVMDMVSKGLIPSGKAIEMLTAGMTKRFGGMMASMENTWQGVTSSIKDIWRMTVGTLTETLFGGLNNMLRQVRDFMAAFYSYLQGILGKKVKQSTDALVGSTKAQAAAIDEVGNASEKAAKKANKNLQVFDEVHQLQEEMSGTSAGGMPTAGTAAVAPLELEDTGEPEAFSKFQEVFEKLAVLFGPVVDGFNKLKEAAEPIVKNIGEGLKWLWDEVLVPFGSWVISEAIPAFFNLLAGVFKVLNPILESFKPLGQWLWDSFLLPIATWTGEAFVVAINAVGDALKAIGDWMSENKSVVEGITIALAAFFAAWEITKLMAFIQMSGGVVAAIMAMTAAIWSNIAAKIVDKAETIAIIALYAKDFIVSLAKGVASLATNTAAWIANTAAMVAAKVAQVAMTAATAAWNAICGIATTLTTAFGAAMAFLTSPIGLVVLAIGAVIAIVVLLVKHWDEVKAAAIACWEGIKEKWDEIKKWWENNALAKWWREDVEPWFTKEKWLELFDNIRKGIKEKWDEIKEWWEKTTLVKWWREDVEPWFTKEKWKDLYDNIKTSIQEKWNEVKEWWNRSALVKWWNEDVEPWFTKEKWKEVYSTIKDTLEETWEEIKNKPKEWGKNLIENFTKGIEEKTNSFSLKDSLKSAGEKIKNFLGFSSPTKEGPGREADKWAPNFMEMFRKGIVQGLPGIRASVSSIADEMAGLASMTVQPAVQATASAGYMADSGMMSEGIAQAVYRAIIDAFRIAQASYGQSGNDDKELVLKIDNTVLARMQLPAIIREGQRQGLNLVIQPQGV